MLKCFRYLLISRLNFNRFRSFAVVINPKISANSSKRHNVQDYVYQRYNKDEEIL